MAPKYSPAYFRNVARGMMESDPLGLDEIVAKHHGDDAMLDLFVTDMFGVPMLDDDGVAIRRDEPQFQGEREEDEDVSF